MASIEERLTKIVSDHLGVPPKDLKPESKLEDDLHADSLDLVELVMSIEDEFELNIPDDEAGQFRTFGDLVKYVREHQDA